MKEYKVTVDEKGNIRWYNSEGQRHREDGPAVEWTGGGKEWWMNGQRHREDGPAIEWANGDKEWYLNGERHREDGPARVSDGSEDYYLNDRIYSKEEYYTKKNTCDGKVVEIDGKKYQLKEIK